MACDPTRNALIAKAEDSNDERDARRLGLLARTGSLQHVYVPAEPFRTIRSLSCYESQLTRQLIQGMQRIKAHYRRYGVQYVGRALYSKASRGIYVDRLPTAATKFQVESHIPCRSPLAEPDGLCQRSWEPGGPGSAGWEKNAGVG